MGILQKSRHANIMNVLEILVDDTFFYIVSELLEGGELFDRLLDEESFEE